LPSSVQTWLRRLGGTLDQSRSRSGVYLLLYGIGVLMIEYFVHHLRRLYEQNTPLTEPQ
jgi:hypothetical protein